MNDLKKTENYLKNVNINLNPQQDQNIHDNLQKILKESKNQPTAKTQPNIWKIIMNSKITKFTAAAGIIFAVIIGLSQFGTPFDANQAYANVVESIKQARTFSCKVISESIKDDQIEVYEEVYMFKEPDIERVETRVYRAGELHQEFIDILDFSKRQRLYLSSDDMSARLYDVIVETVDLNTGDFKIAQLDTSMSDQLLELSRKETVKDLGSSELHGKSVRILQSRVEDRIYTIWIDLQTNYPMQIERKMKKPDGSDHKTSFTEIQIDTDLDDDLFSLEPPEGYYFRKIVDQRSSYKKKLMVKMSSLLRVLVMYQFKHNDQYPGELVDLVTAGFYTEDTLQRVLASPDDPDGPPVIKYRQPHLDDVENEIVLYEVYNQWPDDGFVVGFENSSVFMYGPDDQERFEELIK